jgi:hypothetical protein
MENVAGETFIPPKPQGSNALRYLIQVKVQFATYATLNH